MKTLWQYTLARLGLWQPQIGEMYYADENFVYDPFKPDRQPYIVKVSDVQCGHVQYHHIDRPESLDSTSIKGFASYYLRKKR